MKSISQIKKALQGNLKTAKTEAERGFAIGRALHDALEHAGIPIVDAQLVNKAKDLTFHVETTSREAMGQVRGIMKLVHPDLKVQVGPEDDEDGVSSNGDTFVSCFVLASR